MEITSFKDLERYAAGEVVELPPFAQNQPFVARLKRPSMLALVRKGQIPNSLLNAANSMFEQGCSGAFDATNPDTMADMMGVLETMCEASFMEPTYAEIKESGVVLTDQQLMFVFNYAQAGVKALEPFRTEQTDPTVVGSGEIVQMPTE